MKAVNGVRVTPVRKPIIPSSTIRFGWSLATKRPRNEPIVAPMASDGEKIPPAAPDRYEIIVPRRSLARRYSGMSTRPPISVGPL